MAKTTIEWTARCIPSGTIIPGYTFNVVWGCQKVSEGCKHCYADTLASRFGYSVWGPQADRRVFSPAYWRQPLRWNQEAEAQGYTRLVFCSSMADVFEDHPTVEQERQKLWPLISQTPCLSWLLLTKRPQNILQMVPYGSCWPTNVWVGTSVENQCRAEERIPALLRVPAMVRFLSCEPLLSSLDLTSSLSFLDWVIAGGESGPSARPMNPQWVRDLRGQCQRAKVPFFFKQWGGRYHSSGGCLLDGLAYHEMPSYAL
jgi:protein gp37